MTAARLGSIALWVVGLAGLLIALVVAPGVVGALVGWLSWVHVEATFALIGFGFVVHWTIERFGPRLARTRVGLWLARQ